MKKGVARGRESGGLEIAIYGEFSKDFFEPLEKIIVEVTVRAKGKR
ncbi:MAG: hypothetical protein ACE5I5_01245 [Candidatus Heimdallarchaeota archaeon]